MFGTLRSVRLRLRALFSHRHDRELREEIDAHLEQLVEHHRASGLTPAAARAAAHRQFGNTTRLQERSHDLYAFRLLEEAARDARYTWRSLGRRPLFAGAVLLTLAFGIGADTAVFSVAQAVALRPLPYAAPEQLVMLWVQSREAAEPRRGIATPAHFLGWREHQTAFTDLAALDLWSSSLDADIDFVGHDGAERLRGAFATPNVFELVGVNARLGRTFTEADAEDDPYVVVLSDGLWRRLGADPALIGDTLRLTLGRRDPETRTRERVALPFTVIGVLPPRVQFTYPDETELWVPLPWYEVETARRQAVSYHVIGRTRRGVSLAQAQTDIIAAQDAFVANHPEEPFWDRATVRLEPMHEYVVGAFLPAMWLLTGMAGFVLLIACVNRDRGEPRGSAPPTPPHIRVTYTAVRRIQ